MIRERRDKEKLEQYYRKFVADGTLDPNIHPWIADSWKRCQARKLPNEKSAGELVRLSEQEFNERLENNKAAADFIDGIYECGGQYLTEHNVAFVLLDEESYVLKCYAPPRQNSIINALAGARMSERDLGTTSVSVAREHKAPFLMFGAEAWLKDFHGGLSCAAPVTVDGRLRYLIAFLATDGEDAPYEFIVPFVLNIKYSLENYLLVYEKKQALAVLLDALPLAAYCVRAGGKVTYANSYGKKRLDGSKDLSEVFLNYEHIPINKGFQGMPSYNREVFWVARDRTYEDITTVLPLKTGEDIVSVMAASFSVKTLKTIIAHAAGYTARYDIFSMAGETENFVTARNKAVRVAKSNNNVLLQGESGTGKQRLAHGIHQLSSRAARPFITVQCGKAAGNAQDAEIFGYGEEGSGWISGKLALADTGILFIDEIEKLSKDTGNKLARALTDKEILFQGSLRKIDVRLIAACDSNLKRLSEKGLFSRELYDILSQITVRVPALRERIPDVEILSNHIIGEIAARHNLPAKRLSPESLPVLRQCNWPGNIKQLRQVLELAFFHTPGSIINTENIKLSRKAAAGKSWKHDKEAFVAAWKAAGGNISKLGIMLDVSRVTLYRYLKKYRLANYGND